MNNSLCKYKEPKYGELNFSCPFCGVHAQQIWDSYPPVDPRAPAEIPIIVLLSKCGNCEEHALWVDEGNTSKYKMVYPKNLPSPPPHEDMPEPVKDLYLEAREVSDGSARAAAALLRCALEKLTEELGEKEGSLNSRIGNLAKKGLPEKVVQALDIVRINANEGGAHCGEIDLTGQDGKEIVEKLFWLVNFVVTKTIAEPNEVAKAFNKLPKDKKAGIDNRDNKERV